jgi:DNA-directed RNA polymerase specialized sigma24 family protein
MWADEVWAELQRKYKKHPRAKDQLTAVILRELLGYEVNEIGAHLGEPSIARVSLLISRGREKLRNNQGLRDLYLGGL